MSLIRTGSRTRRSSWPWARGSRSGSRFAAAVTGSAACTASTGEDPRATSSAAPPAASRSSASRRSSSTACRPSISTECCPGCAISPTCRSVVYPNLGYYSEAGWRFDERVGPEAYAEHGRRLAGGRSPDRGGLLRHLAGAHRRGRRPTRRNDVPAGRPRSRSRRSRPMPFPSSQRSPRRPGGTSWDATSTRCPFRRSSASPTSSSRRQAAFSSGSTCGSRRSAPGKRCLDVGCGSGLLAIQLALNGAEHVHAVDIQRQAVANTLANAFRNGVSDRVTGAEADIYTYEPSERYDVVVASLYQMPVDPYEQFTGHRPLDYWGRNLVDHFIRLLPRVLADEGVAYLMQLSIISQLRTDGDPRGAPASPPASSTSASSATGRSSTSTRSRSGASRRSPMRTTWISAARTSSSRTCSRSRAGPALTRAAAVETFAGEIREEE